MVVDISKETAGRILALGLGLVASASLKAADKESPYAFRSRLETVHETGRRDPGASPAEDEFVLSDGCEIVTSPSASDLVRRAAADFADYLEVSMSVTPGANGRGVRVSLDPSMDGRSAVIDVKTNGVFVTASDDRAAAQALYHLEDLMNLRRAPFLKVGRTTRKQRFSPRMTHSGWGLDRFPDAHLAQMAHYGLDAVVVFTLGPDKTQGGGQNAGINDIIRRAKAWGLDTYLYSKIPSFVHPLDPKADDLFEKTFGSVAAAHPGAKGIVLVGESCEFPSRDPHTCGKSYLDKRDPGDTRPLPGWYPCSDYPDWLSAVRKAIRRHAPDMEVVFWTYNWSREPTELIDGVLKRFPKDVVIQSTIDLDGIKTHANGFKHYCQDYTISYVGPTVHFASDAKTAAGSGLRLYAMSNTGGLTWDAGTIPYQPCPYQWKRRWDVLNGMQRESRLAGLMESHHYGWHPSFVSELAKEAFVEGGIPFDEHIRRIAVRDFGEGNADAVLAVWRRWSEAAEDYPATNGNQYGPFRLGPSYPFSLGGGEIGDREFPQTPSATHVIRWMAYLNYPFDKTAADKLNVTYDPLPPAMSEREIELLESVRKSYCEGSETIRRMARTLDGARRAKALRLADLGEYMGRTAATAANLWRARRAREQGDQESFRSLVRAEYANAEAALVLVERDSRLGWEPSMEYVGGPEQIRWKLARMRQDYEAGWLSGDHRGEKDNTKEAK